MKFKTISQDELELMSFDDIAYVILKEKGKKMKTPDLFRIICDTLGMSDKEYEARIADFFTLLATEKRFLQLEKGFWDLRENHTAQIIKEDDEELLDEEIVSDEENEEELTEDSIYDETKDIEDDEGEDDLKDLVVVDEELEKEDL